MSNRDVKELQNYSIEHFYDDRDLDRAKDSTTAKDDYALQRVPGDWRFGAWSSGWSWMGLSTALAYPLTGALLTFAFGAISVMVGFLLSMILIGFGVFFTSMKSANEGIGKDLMSRSSYGYNGSIVISLLVGTYLVILFALETSVIAAALHEYLPILPFWLWVGIIIAVIIPLGIYGMVLLSKIQFATFLLYLIGIALVFIGLFSEWSELTSAAFADKWWELNPNNVPISWMTIVSATGAWLGAFGFMNIFAVTDITRMTRRRERKKGAVIQILINTVINSFMIGAMGIFFLAASNGVNPDPGVTFVWVLGPVGVLLVCITQLRGNVMNMYLGSLALNSAVSQITKKTLMRSWFLIPFAVLGFILVNSSFLDYYPTIATIAGVLFSAWVGSYFGEHLLVRPFYSIPKWGEIRRGYLPDINWIGFSSLVVPILIGLIASFGVWGEGLQAMAVFVSLVLSFIMPVVIARMLGKEKVVKQYFGRIPEVPKTNSATMNCFVTGETHHKSDFVFCPFYDDNWISSSTCAGELNCKKMCQSDVDPNEVAKDQSV
ncbi:purine-cytosine permease family protein [Salipaludibacillus sp. CF4.18]|uniref:purine-cytosine permease family protein n=1 Tax=Salipaludibacillus sp. CF4.18 TaxID=3373081 RepID=UPI003EE5AD47